MSNFFPARQTTTLRQRARSTMIAEVETLAFGLFLEQGYENTSIEQITSQAGISRSTFFRYFPTKEDLVVGGLAEWGSEIYAALRARPDQEPVWVSLGCSLEPLIAATVADPVGTRKLTTMIYETAALEARRYQKTLQWQALLIPEVSRRLGLDGDDPSDPRPRALVASLLDCFTAALICWAREDASEDLGSLVSKAMASLRVD